MPRFFFAIKTWAGVEPDMTGVTCRDGVTAVRDCLEAIADGLQEAEYDDMLGVTIEDESRHVIATIDVEAIRRLRPVCSQ